MAVLALLVPAPTSFAASISATEISWWESRRATAAPTTPAPTTTTSIGSSAIERHGCFGDASPPFESFVRLTLADRRLDDRNRGPRLLSLTVGRELRHAERR